MGTDPDELVNACHPAKDGIVTDLDFTGQAHIINQDHIIADPAVVRDMCIGHDQAIVTDDCLSERPGTLVYGDAFPDNRVVADFDMGNFTLIFKILWYGRDDRSREDLAVFPDPGPVENGYVGTDPGSLPYFHILTDDRKSIHHGSRCDAGFRMDRGERMNH
jgi:hypothetical protein